MAGTKRAANNKTKPEKASAADFIANIKDDDVRKDCQQIVKLMRRVTGEKPVMWGASMVGFGQYPRKANLTLYVMPGFEAYGTKLAKLGKHKLGKSCLYLQGLEGIDLKVLEEILADAVKKMSSQKPAR